MIMYLQSRISLSPRGFRQQSTHSSPIIICISSSIMKFSWSGVNAFEAGSYLPHYSTVSSSSPGQLVRRSTSHELSKILIILENKRANRIVVHHLRLSAQHVAHDRSIALEAICLRTKTMYSLSLSPLRRSKQQKIAYKTVRNHVVLL